jgi:dipeptidase
MTIQAISKLYTANFDNRVVLFSTNLKDFAEALALLDPTADPYHTLRRKFEKQSEIQFTARNKEYLLQEVYNAKKSS